MLVSVAPKAAQGRLKSPQGQTKTDQDKSETGPTQPQDRPKQDPRLLKTNTIGRVHKRHQECETLFHKQGESANRTEKKNFAFESRLDSILVPFDFVLSCGGMLGSVGPKTSQVKPKTTQEQTRTDEDKSETTQTAPNRPEQDPRHLKTPTVFPSPALARIRPGWENNFGFSEPRIRRHEHEKHLRCYASNG